jgi:transcriptional regulator with XRE-family HTH domain
MNVMSVAAGQFIGPVSKILGELLRYIRKKHKLTQKDLAEMLGVSPAYISNAENGKLPLKTTMDMIKALV